jgi:glycerol-3-phosphate dehydrogenase
MHKSGSTSDVIVIGGGIAGLLTSVRLADQGLSVVCLDELDFAGGSTAAMHGMVHSGAMYVERHPEIVHRCREAYACFATLFPTAFVPSDHTVYAVRAERQQEFATLFQRHGLGYRALAGSDVPEFRPEFARTVTAFEVPERVVSPQRILAQLTAECAARGVVLYPRTAVEEITTIQGQVTGVRLGRDQRLTASIVVLCAGMGSRHLLSGLGSRHQTQLHSRASVMVRARTTLRRGLAVLDEPGPVIMLNATGDGLISAYGGDQPAVDKSYQRHLDLAQLKVLKDRCTEVLDPGAIRISDGVAYMGVKTDYTGSRLTEKNAINPDFKVIDHSDSEAIGGLYTVIPGKSTLAFHASRSVVEHIVHKDVDLIVRSRTHRELTRTIDLRDRNLTVVSPLPSGAGKASGE